MDKIIFKIFFRGKKKESFVMKRIKKLSYSILDIIKIIYVDTIEPTVLGIIYIPPSLNY